MQQASAQRIAFARAHLTESGVLDDPYAKRFLHPGGNRFATALVRLDRAGIWPNRLAYVAARTRFYDAAVNHALDAGARQVVIVGAGYDSRAWLLARDGVAFYEVDLPGPQEDKRRRSPPGGPTFVSTDLRTDALGRRLLEAGFDASKPSMFVCEGITMHLPRAAVVRLLDEMAGVAAPKSHLATDFAGGEGSRQQHWINRTLCTVANPPSDSNSTRAWSLSS